LKHSNKPLFAAAMIMATSAIGPGFLTQTTVFTEQLRYNFGFIILLSIAIDIIAQVTIWKTLSYGNRPVQSFAADIHPALSFLLILGISLGGLIFNIGNLAGTGLGIAAMTDTSPAIGTFLSALVAGSIFYSKSALPKLDTLVKTLGVLMLVLLIVMIFLSDLDFGKLLHYTLLPEKVDIKATLTLVGGTVGGYITFAGAQRLLDSGLTGPANQDKVARSAYQGIVFTGAFRFMLYVGVLSTVVAGVGLSGENPTASVFEAYFGSWGMRLFGLMIWAASLTSVLGATYTSMAFLKDLYPIFQKRVTPLFFIGISLLVYLSYDKPVKLLLMAGYVNSFILPLALGVVLWAIAKHPSLKGMPINAIAIGLGWGLVLLLSYFGIISLL
jgi:Mn2+/Fe2+ NRAMP family transporter